MKNWISEENLKKAVEELHMDRLAKERIIMGCEKGHGNTYRKRKKLKVIIAFSALTIFLFCLPVRAQVKESLKQWLSHMTQKHTVYQEI